MVWFISMALIFTFAGIGVKWAVDRLFGPQIQMVMPPRHAAPPEKTPARRVLEFDDTMDVLASGVEVGKQIATAHPLSAAEPGAGGTWEPRQQLALAPAWLRPGDTSDEPIAGPGVCVDEDGAYKLSGPCVTPAAPQQVAAGGST